MPFPLAFLLYPYLLYGFVPPLLSSIYPHSLFQITLNLCSKFFYLYCRAACSFLWSLGGSWHLGPGGHWEYWTSTWNTCQTCLFNKDSFISQRDSRAIYSCFSCLKPPVSGPCPPHVWFSCLLPQRAQLKEEQTVVEREEHGTHLPCWILGILAHH